MEEGMIKLRAIVSLKFESKSTNNIRVLYSTHLGTTATYGSFESAIKTANAGSFIHTKKCG